MQIIIEYLHTRQLSRCEIEKNYLITSEIELKENQLQTLIRAIDQGQDLTIIHRGTRELEDSNKVFESYIKVVTNSGD